MVDAKSAIFHDAGPRVSQAPTTIVPPFSARYSPLLRCYRHRRDHQTATHRQDAIVQDSHGTKNERSASLAGIGIMDDKFTNSRGKDRKKH